MRLTCRSLHVGSGQPLPSAQVAILCNSGTVSGQFKKPSVLKCPRNDALRSTDSGMEPKVGVSDARRGQTAGRHRSGTPLYILRLSCVRVQTVR